MTEPTYPLVLDQLGKLRAIGTQLSVDCNICHKHTMLDLDKVIERLGEDHGCMHWDLIKRFYCADCRAAGREDRNIQFQVHPNTKPNDYAKAKGT